VCGLWRFVSVGSQRLSEHDKAAVLSSHGRVHWLLVIGAPVLLLLGSLCSSSAVSAVLNKSPCCYWSQTIHNLCDP
jgi:hypothetical protein